MKLMVRALIKLLCGVAAITLLLFLPAGTFHYPGGLLFCAMLFIPMLIVGTILLIKDPELLEKRLNSKEQEQTQKLVILISVLEFIGCFMAAGWTFASAGRMCPLRWSSSPPFCFSRHTFCIQRSCGKTPTSPAP